MEKVVKNSTSDGRDAVVFKGDNEKKPIMSGWRWIWGAVIASFLAWVPFFGYTHLIQMLEVSGFRGVYIEPKTYDLVYYFLMGWSKVVNNGLSSINAEQMLNLSLKLLGFALLIGSILAVFFRGVTYFFKRKEYGVNKGKKIDLKDYISMLLIESHDSWKDFFRLWIAIVSSVFSIAMIEVIAFIVLFILSSFLWFLSLTGYLSGISAGKEIVVETECTQRDPSKNELNNKFRVGCSLLKVGGEEIQGIRIYSDNKHIFFIGDEGAYQTDYQGNLILFSPIERLGEKEGKEGVDE